LSILDIYLLVLRYLVAARMRVRHRPRSLLLFAYLRHGGACNPRCVCVHCYATSPLSMAQTKPNFGG